MQALNYTYDYPRPALAVDCVVFGVDLDKRTLNVLLVQRGTEPSKGAFALPGGFVQVSDEGPQGESIEEAARRELEEKTRVKVSHLEQLYTFGRAGRDPRGRVISIAHLALVRSPDHDVVAGDNASRALWIPIETAEKLVLAFDHKDILRLGKERLAGKVTYTPLAFSLLPDRFSLADAHDLYEVILQRKLNLSNFRKKLLKLGVLTPAGVKRSRTGGRMPALFMFDSKRMEQIEKLGFFFNLQPERRRGRGYRL